LYRKNSPRFLHDDDDDDDDDDDSGCVFEGTGESGTRGRKVAEKKRESNRKNPRVSPLGSH